jgi:hypothetical protein
MLQPQQMPVPSMPVLNMPTMQQQIVQSVQEKYRNEIMSVFNSESFMTAGDA